MDASTEKEIVKSYNSAKNKFKQLDIISDIYSIDIQSVITVLVDNDIIPLSADKFVDFVKSAPQHYEANYIKILALANGCTKKEMQALLEERGYVAEAKRNEKSTKEESLDLSTTLFNTEEVLPENSDSISAMDTLIGIAKQFISYKENQLQTLNEDLERHLKEVDDAIKHLQEDRAYYVTEIDCKRNSIHREIEQAMESIKSFEK